MKMKLFQLEYENKYEICTMLICADTAEIATKIGGNKIPLALTKINEVSLDEEAVIVDFTESKA
jgi:hypothetical protein